jgi:AcrR family transcriptional regulator
MPPEQRREQLLNAALGVILEQGYSGVSIEAIARSAGVTRPVVYDHYSNLAELLHALIEREENYALAQLMSIVPDDPGASDPAELLSGGVRRFLEAVADRPATWTIILLPLEGTPAIVREHVATNRARVLERVQRLVAFAATRPEIPADADVELIARSIVSLGEEAGRMVLTDPARFPPERYERFVKAILKLVQPPDAAAD